MENTILNITLKKGNAPFVATPEGDHPPLQPKYAFKGPESTPLLAPRGVFLRNGALFVSDTGRNRVFIWNRFPESEFQEPDVVLGQGDADGTGRNAGGTVNEHTLQYPSGIWSDGRRLVVADAWNHRVLIWHELPTRHGQPADVVVGQPDFHSNQPNAQQVGADPDARTLFWPYGVFSDGQRLWIADTGNRRVLYYDTFPERHFEPAQGVVGKPDFHTRDYENLDPIWPYSVKIGPDGSMAVTDTQYYRVLVWRDWRRAFQQKADLVIGQPDMDSNGQNQYMLHPMPHTLSWCYDACFFKNGLLVADTGNSRVLRFDRLPEHNSPAADGLIGKPDFYTGSEFAETVFGTEKSLYWPFSICADQDLLAVADTGNHRILMYGV
ncbi:MAG: NHL repeat-containing protein [Saprospiraceae bacterium]|nr:NHL repeat-containing protein [Saprospiraceae bacterium]